ncbi:MAG: FHA domain-containing protein [Prevotella sp.]|nr:FHA domain-containing protein [Prevotella sp.]
MTITVGRKAETNQLNVAYDGQPGRAYGAVGSVPNTVSRSHFRLDPDGKGGYRLTSLNPNNQTLVNGVRVSSANVRPGDRIEMGSGRFVFDWKALGANTNHTGGVSVVSGGGLNIKPLEAVWENYQSERMKIQIRQGRLNAVGRLTGVLSMVGTVFAVMDHSHGSSTRLIFLVIAIVAAAAVSAVTFINASKVPQKVAALDKQFQMTYVCPNPACRCFMGNQPYHVLAQRPACPYCKTRYATK